MRVNTLTQRIHELREAHHGRTGEYPRYLVVSAPIFEAIKRTFKCSSVGRHDSTTEAALSVYMDMEPIVLNNKDEIMLVG